MNWTHSVELITAFLIYTYLNYIIPWKYILKETGGCLCILLLQRNNTLKTWILYKDHQGPLLPRPEGGVPPASHTFSEGIHQVRKQLCSSATLSGLHFDKRPRRVRVPFHIVHVAGGTLSRNI